MMSEWKEYKIKDITSRITSGGTPKSSEASFYDGTIPWLNTKEINFNRITKTERYITEEGLNNSSAKWIPKGSVIIAMYGATAAKVAYSLIDLTTNQACCNLIIDEDKANSQFVYYYIQSSYEELLNLACGAAQQNLSVGVIGDFPIYLPPLDEQKRIASILCSLDDKIDLLNRENATLEAMAETLFRQWFIEEAKEDWEERSLLDCIKLVGGGTPTTSNPKYWNGNIYWLSGGDIASNHKKFACASAKCISNVGLNNSSAKLLPEDAMVVSARGTVGKYCLLSKPMTFSQSNYGILPVFDKCYFFTYLLVAYHIDELQSAAYGSVFDTITTKTFEGVNVTLPQKENYITEFEKIIEPYFSKIKHNELQKQSLIKTRDILLPQLMSNEINVE